MTKRCSKNAPYLCIPETDKPGLLAQCCCNSWECPRCGELRARHEYGRMVSGARELSEEHTLWFITITCTGDGDWVAAQNSYLANTNRLLSTCRAHAKKMGCIWSYAAVTERQERLHPHSHMLTTFCPSDAFCVVDNYERYLESVKRINERLPAGKGLKTHVLSEWTLLDYWSEWFVLACHKAGLGIESHISIVDSVEACSRYVAKYLFKQTAFDRWPKGWKRIRYSQNWPKLPERHNPLAFAVLSNWDWYMVEDAGELVTHSTTVYEKARERGLINVILHTECPIDKIS